MSKKRFLEIDEDEKILVEVKRHPIGLLPIYFFGLMVTALFVSFGIGLPLIGELSDIVSGSIFYIVFFLLAGLAFTVTYIAAKIYKANELVLTNESLVQILQKSLFARSVSQLSLASVQDVTVEQPNFFSNAFNYGTIIVETAGEQANFVFRYAKNPFQVSKHIIEAAEKYVEEHGISNI